MSFDPGIEPFRVTKLTELIAEEILELIQLGFGKQQGTPMTVIEKRDSGYARIPRKEDSQPWTGFCTYLRSFPTGDQLCSDCDQRQATKIFSLANTSPEEYTCHAGLIDISIPIVIGGKIVAVFLGGQKRRTESPEKIYAAVKKLAKRIDQLDLNKLMALASAVEELPEEGMQAYVNRLHMIVNYITTLAKDSYDTQRRLQEELFLEAAVSYFMRQYGKERRPVQQVIQEILIGFNQFAGMALSVFSSGQDILPMVSAPQVSGEILGDRLKDAIDGLTGLSAGKLTFGHQDRVVVYPIADESFLQKLTGVVEVPLASRIYLSRFDLLNEISGQFVFVGDGYPGNDEFDNQLLAEKRRFLEDFVSHMREQLNAYLVDEEESDLLASLAHQLKSPMNSMLGRCWALRDKCRSATHSITPSQAEGNLPNQKQSSDGVFDDIDLATRDIENYVNILKYKTDSLLYLTVKEKGQMGFDFRLRSIPELLRRRVECFRSQGARYGKTIRLQLGSGADKRVVIDQSRMEIVFDNLLDNAIKYSHANKEIVVTACVDEVKDRYIVRVDNFGLGIMPEERELIFKRYYRSKMAKDTKRQISGTGIGLAVVKSIVEAHDGTVEVVSYRGPGDPMRGRVEGEGYRTIFTMELPLRQ